MTNLAPSPQPAASLSPAASAHPAPPSPAPAPQPAASAPPAASPQAYRQNAVLAASGPQLIVMLYDGARRFLRQAGTAMREREIERAHNALRRAETILVYLDDILDETQQPLAGHLHAIYEFSLRHLHQARLSQDADSLEEVSRLLGELREAWDEVARA